jgi:hypothetical protein
MIQASFDMEKFDHTEPHSPHTPYLGVLIKVVLLFNLEAAADEQVRGADERRDRHTAALGDFDHGLVFGRICVCARTRHGTDQGKKIYQQEIHDTKYEMDER